MRSSLPRGACLCLKVGEWIASLLLTRKRRTATVEQHVLPSAEGATQTMRSIVGFGVQTPSGCGRQAHIQKPIHIQKAYFAGITALFVILR